MDNRFSMMGQFLLLTVVYLTHIALTLGEEAAVVSTNNETNTIRSYSVKESHVHEILIEWNITADCEFEEYLITHQRRGSISVTTSILPNNISQEFLITDLVAETVYDVCFSLNNIEKDSECNGELKKCMSMSTIPVIRDDSLIAVIITLGVILLLILIGYLCWHYAKKRLEKDEDEEGSEAGSDESKQPILLQVPSSNGPRRSVDFEDQDIPYITPPLEDTRKQEGQTKAATNTLV